MCVVLRSVRFGSVLCVELLSFVPVHGEATGSPKSSSFGSQQEPCLDAYVCGVTRSSHPRSFLLHVPMETRQVNKQYVCEMPAGSQPVDSVPLTVKPSPAPTSAPMTSPTPSPRATTSPLPVPVTPRQVSPTAKPTETPETPTPADDVPTAASTPAPSASPTVAEVEYGDDGHCDELLTEADRR